MAPGFKISVYAADVPEARQMAWGDKGTLFVGSWFDAGNVYAITDEGGKKVVKTILTKLTVPTGIAFRDGALYVADVNKIYKYDNAEANLDKMPAPKIVYDDMPPYIPHGWKYLAFDKKGMLYVAFGPPCNECLAPTSTMQVRRINPNNGTAEIIALGVRNSVGGDIDPRTGDYWFSRERARLDQRRSAERQARAHRRRACRISAIPIAIRATCRIPSTPWDTNARSSSRRPTSSARMWRRWA